MKIIIAKKIQTINEEYTVSVLIDENEHVQIERIAKRNNVKNKIDSCTCVDEHGEKIRLLDVKTALEIVNRLEAKTHKWSDAFIFSTLVGKKLEWVKSSEEHKYTSTGIKFWRHPDSMQAFRNQEPNSIISTHISPEGSCNLKCPYCSVTYRDTHSRIELSRIKKYVNDLRKYGLKAVILTGGGEPTIYKEFNELVCWLAESGLSVGLITNGTQTHRISDEALKCFSWVRISINVFDGWQEKISFPHKKLSSDCVVGCSLVYTGEHENSHSAQKNQNSFFENVSSIADRCGATYIRVLPNCLLEQGSLLLQHQSLEAALQNTNDKRYFQQYKIHGAPNVKSCNQAYFRPYLSEEPWHEDGVPGTVFPCDSVVLNQSTAHFAKQYQICKPEDISLFLERKLDMNFCPDSACSGCVFTDNVEMLEQWRKGEISRFDEFQEPIKHEEFV